MTRLEHLLKMVADRPEGEKVNIPAIVRYFTPTQAKIIEAIQHLIDAGHLDPVTLRRVKVAEPICAPEESTAEDQDSPPCEEPPGAAAADETGGGDARCGAPPPDTRFHLARLLDCFSDEFETLRVVAQRFGAPSFRSIVRHARTLHERGFVEQQLDRSGYKTQPRMLWRRSPDQLLINGEPVKISDLPESVVEQLSKKTRPKGPPSMAERNRRWEANHPNTRGASRTAREAPSVTGSPVTEVETVPTGTASTEEVSAKWIEDRAPHHEPASRICPPASARQSPQPVRRASPSAAPPAMAVESEVADAVAPVAPRPALEKPPRSVDIKVNIGPRDLTREPDADVLDYAEHERVRAERQRQKYKRGVRARARRLIESGQQAGTNGLNSEVRGAMKEIRENEEAQQRAFDPVEQAKTVIRIAGYCCFSAIVNGGPKDKFYIGTKLVTREELLAKAERLRERRA